MNRTFKAAAVAAGAVLALGVAAPANAQPPAATSTTVVTVSANGDGGWGFNSDSANYAPYSLAGDTLSVGPIGSTPANKFIGVLPLGIPASDLSSVKYDFKIASPATSNPGTDYKQFYLNVYVNLPASPSTNYYDCRYDAVPITGSATDFTTVTADASTLALGNARNGASCPTFVNLNPTSTVKFIALNVGDTSTSDAGISGEFDNVVVATTAGTTVYDFGDADNKADCKDGGWQTVPGGFTNQGDCVSAYASQK